MCFWNKWNKWWGVFCFSLWIWPFCKGKVRQMRQQVLVPRGWWEFRVPASSLLAALPGELCPFAQTLGRVWPPRGAAAPQCVWESSAFTLGSWMLLADVETTLECVTRQRPTDGLHSPALLIIQSKVGKKSNCQAFPGKYPFPFPFHIILLWPVWSDFMPEHALGGAFPALAGHGTWWPAGTRGCNHRAHRWFCVWVCSEIKRILKRWEQRVRTKAMVCCWTVFLAVIAQILEQSRKLCLINHATLMCPTVSKNKCITDKYKLELYSFAEGHPKGRRQRAGTAGSRCHGYCRCSCDCKPCFEYENFKLGGTRVAKRGKEEEESLC